MEWRAYFKRHLVQNDWVVIGRQAACLERKNSCAPYTRPPVHHLIQQPTNFFQMPLIGGLFSFQTRIFRINFWSAPKANVCPTAPQLVLPDRTHICGFSPFSISKGPGTQNIIKRSWNAQNASLPKYTPVCPAPPTIYSRWPTIRILAMPKHNQHALPWLTNLSPETKIQEIKKVQSHAPACASAREGHTAMTHRHHRLIDSCQRKFRTQPKKYRAGLQCVAQINLEFRPHDSKLFESGVCHLAI